MYQQVDDAVATAAVSVVLSAASAGLKNSVSAPASCEAANASSGEIACTPVDVRLPGASASEAASSTVRPQAPYCATAAGQSPFLPLPGLSPANAEPFRASAVTTTTATATMMRFTAPPLP